MKNNRKFLATALTGAAVVGALGISAGAVKAVPSTHKLYFKNQPADVAAYNIEGSNYFKLRDIAKLVDFPAVYNPKDNSVILSISGNYYETSGAVSPTKAPIQTAEAKISPQIVYLDGTKQDMTVYNINGSNYFKLRELGDAIGFKVEFDAAASRVDIAAPISSWNSLMDEFNEKVTACLGDRKDKPYTPSTQVSEALQKTALDYEMQITGRNLFGKNDKKLLSIAAALDSMQDAPLEVGGQPANRYLADEIRLLAGRAHLYDWTTDAEQSQPTASDDKKPVDTSPVTEADLRAWELEMVDAVNAERRKAGVPELEIKKEAMEYARYWAEHCKTKFRHSEYLDFCDYADQLEMDRETVYHALGGGENIVRFTGGNSVGHPMKAVMDSPGHKATMLSSDNKYIGIGFAVAENGEIFCVQLFPRY